MAAGIDLAGGVDWFVEGCMGDGRGEGAPFSEISVLDDSAPGEELDFQPKKEVILLPGVLGCFASIEPVDALESTRSGGGGLFVGGCRAIVTDLLCSFCAWVLDDAFAGEYECVWGSLERRTWFGRSEEGPLI